MTLAQVVYQISVDADFAAQMRTEPERALAERGLKLSKEEQAFLSRGLKREARGDGSKVSMSDIAALYARWG
ncbi:MAG: hypothetical protein GYA34_19190 [Chloroflexi bacterium]|nr:hypothetical protein [Chloroflexota bacterium]